MEALIQENIILRKEIERLKEQLMKKNESETVVQLACGGQHSLALFKDGTIKGWGNNEFGQSQAQNFSAEGRKAIQIACGQKHSVALLDDGTLRGWGDGLVTYIIEEKQSDLSYKAVKKQNNLLEFPQFSQKVIRIICGDLSSCALLHDKRTVVTWGYPYTKNIFTYDKDVKQIECGGVNYFIALFEDGTIEINGYFAFLTQASRDRLLTTIKENHKSIKRIACGWGFFLALSDEKFMSYGSYLHLESNPNEVINLKNITHFGCGIKYCVIVNNNNYLKIIGPGFIRNYIEKKKDEVSSLEQYSQVYLKTNSELKSNVVHLACGPNHFTILLENGDFISYGLNTSGQCIKPVFLSNNQFEKKYLKYKNKYLQLK